MQHGIAVLAYLQNRYFNEVLTAFSRESKFRVMTLSRALEKKGKEQIRARFKPTLRFLYKIKEKYDLRILSYM